eukprot:3181984-Amphidinium_carterae.1
MAPLQQVKMVGCLASMQGLCWSNVIAMLSGLAYTNAFSFQLHVDCVPILLFEVGYCPVDEDGNVCQPCLARMLQHEYVFIFSILIHLVTEFRKETRSQVRNLTDAIKPWTAPPGREAHPRAVQKERPPSALD